MSALFGGNSFTQQRPAFDLMTNICSDFELGDPAGDDVWLQGRIVEGEPVFNGRLFTRHGHAGVVIDCFPKAVPTGWTQRRSIAQDGYDLVNADGDVIFGYRIAGEFVYVSVNLHNAAGDEVVFGGQGRIVVQGIRFRIQGILNIAA